VALQLVQLLWRQACTAALLLFPTALLLRLPHVRQLSTRLQLLLQLLYRLGGVLVLLLLLVCTDQQQR
jgi:hypothetical protein